MCEIGGPSGLFVVVVGSGLLVLAIVCWCWFGRHEVVIVGMCWLLLLSVVG